MLDSVDVMQASSTILVNKLNLLTGSRNGTPNPRLYIEEIPWRLNAKGTGE